MPTKFYVYIYYDPRNMQPFYVGKGKGKRYKAHLSEASSWDGIWRKGKNCSKLQKILDIQKDNLAPIITKVYFSENELDVIAEEARLINLFGRISAGGILTNITEADGARNGCLNGMFGKTHTEEAKQIIRELRAKEKLDPEYSNKKMRANPRCMPVTDGINEYTSIGDAARQLNITMHKAQGMRRRGQLYQVGTEQVLRDSLPGTKEWADFRASKDKRSRPVTDGSNIFPSALSASRFYNVHPHVIHFILKNNKPHKKLHAELQYI